MKIFITEFKRGDVTIAGPDVRAWSLAQAEEIAKTFQHYCPTFRVVGELVERVPVTASGGAA